MTPRAVTFDAGQTLVELDTVLLSARLAERGHAVAAAALDAAQPPAWRRYDAVASTGHETPWQVFMATLLAGAGVDDAQATALAAWLWTEQPRRNLWRRPVAGMFELVRELRAAGVPVGVLSNSEGRLAELLAEIGVADLFAVITDSGRLGIAKPDRRIFEHTAAALGVAVGELVHIGDSRTTDIDGGVAAGARTIWFGAGARPVADPRVAMALDAAAVRAALVDWQLLAACQPAVPPRMMRA